MITSPGAGVFVNVGENGGVLLGVKVKVGVRVLVGVEVLVAVFVTVGVGVGAPHNTNGLEEF
jgi:hypothetical protein